MTIAILSVCLSSMPLMDMPPVKSGNSLDVPAVLDAWRLSGITVGLSVAIVDDDETRYFNSGYHTRALETPVDEHTVYEIGSVTKVFTALLLADMAARGEVSLDDPIDGLLPPGVASPRRDDHSITLRQLAQHTSGLPRLPDNFAPANEQDPYADYTEQRLFEFLKGYKPSREFGSDYEYSNLGAGLLGTLLARRAATPFDPLLRARICQPLEMHVTTCELTDAVNARLATGYHGARAVPGWNIAALAGAGGLRSSTADLARFAQAQLQPDQGPLAAAIRLSQDRAHAARTDSEDTTITLGWHITRTRDGAVYWHNGGTGGYRSFVGFDPQARRGVVVLSNSMYSVDELAMHLLDPANPLKPARTAVDVPVEKLQAHVGKYLLTHLHVFEVTLEEGQLFAKLTGQESLPLWPESEVKFFYREVDAEISFECDDAGKTTALVLHQYGRDQRATRISKPKSK